MRYYLTNTAASAPDISTYSAAAGALYMSATAPSSGTANFSAPAGVQNFNAFVQPGGAEELPSSSAVWLNGWWWYARVDVSAIGSNIASAFNINTCRYGSLGLGFGTTVASITGPGVFDLQRSAPPDTATYAPGDPPGFNSGNFSLANSMSASTITFNVPNTFIDTGWAPAAKRHTLSAASAFVAGTTSAAPTYGTTVSGDIAVLMVDHKPFSSTATATSYTSPAAATATSGSVANGVGTGSTRATVLSRPVTSTLTGGSATASVTSGSPTMAAVATVTPASGLSLFQGDGFGGGDTDETGTTVSVTTTAFSVVEGDFIFVTYALAGTTSFTSGVVTFSHFPDAAISPISFGGNTNIVDANNLFDFQTTTGNDGRADYGVYRCTGGAGSGTMTLTGTATTSGASAIALAGLVVTATPPGSPAAVKYRLVSRAAVFGAAHRRRASW